MIVAYVSKVDQECYNDLRDEFTEIQNFSSIDEFINFYAASNNRDIVLLYKVDDIEDVKLLNSINFRDNLYIVVVGEDSVEMSLVSGKIGVDKYINKTTSDIDTIKKAIKGSQSVIKERRGKSNISVFTGISGGVGTTTITMNLAKSVANNNLDKNVLFLDFTHTKAITNLFFDEIRPNKTIADIPSLQQLNMDELFENGLKKVNNNLYFVSGIQKHTDKDVLTKIDNIQSYLNFIMYVKDKFDYIFIDVGVFEDSDLEIDIQEMADNIFVITEFSIPSMAILKTYINIIDKSGWYNKTHIIANRADSFGAVTHEEATKILSKGLKHDFNIAFSLPNDAMHLRECWNEAQLVSDVYPSCPFMEKIEEFEDMFLSIEDSTGIAEKDKLHKEESLFSRIKQWL